MESFQTVVQNAPKNMLQTFNFYYTAFIMELGVFSNGVS